MRNLKRTEALILLCALFFAGILDTACTNKDTTAFEEKEIKEMKTKEIHIAVFEASDDIEEKARNFNENNSEYQVVIDSYFSQRDYLEGTSKQEAYEKLYRDIIADNAPDIIEVSDIDFYDIASKGAFEDLTPYFENDSELKETPFVDSIINAYRTDGKLYYVPPSFHISALVGAKSRLGDKTSWTMNQFKAFTDSLDEGMKIFSNATCEDMLAMMRYNLLDYIDWESGKCSFDTDNFISLLEICDSYEPAEKFYENDDRVIARDDAENIRLVRENRVALMRLHMFEITGYQIAKLAFGEEDIIVKGYPVVKGNGIVIHTEHLGFAISSKSKYKDKAWEFIRQWYEYDAQLQTSVGFPIREDALMQILENEKEMEGKTAPDETEYYEVLSGSVNIEVPTLTDEDIEEILDIIDRADTVVGNMNDDIYGIICDEAEALFCGNKSAQEVAEIIQSRVSVYVREHR